MLEPGFFDARPAHRAAVVGQARSARRRLSQAVRRTARLGASARHPLPVGLPAGDFVAKLRAEGLLCLTAGENVLRILPPLVVSEREIEEGLGIIDKVAREWPAIVRGQRESGRCRRGAVRRPAGRRRRRAISSTSTSYETGDLRSILDLGFAYKNGRRDRPLEGKTLAMIFEKPSTRTRVSFEVAMRQLGGDAIMLGTADSQLGRGETDRRYRARAVALCRCDHDPHQPRRKARRSGARTPPCR